MTVPFNQVYVDGGAPVTGDGLNTFLQTADTFPTLRNFIGVDGMQVAVAGGAAPGDGNGGLFYWSSSSAAADNNSSVIVPNGSSPGAWLRAAGLLQIVATGYLAASGMSFITQGTAGFQVGGISGPVMFNDTALDTISFQALPGAGPSGNTTNLQIYPPIVGGKSFINITKLSAGANEERLIIGNNGTNYVVSEVIGGTGLPRNIDFLDGGASGVPAFSLIAGNGTTAPSLSIYQGQGIVCGTTLGFEGVLNLDASMNLRIGDGVDINLLFTNKKLSVSNVVVLGQIAAPATPTAGQAAIYLDNADQIVKIKGAGGTVTPIGPP